MALEEVEGFLARGMGKDEWGETDGDFAPEKNFILKEETSFAIMLNNLDAVLFPHIPFWFLQKL